MSVKNNKVVMLVEITCNMMQAGKAFDRHVLNMIKCLYLPCLIACNRLPFCVQLFYMNIPFLGLLFLYKIIFQTGQSPAFHKVPHFVIKSFILKMLKVPFKKLSRS